jgi:hypothetical protein
MKDASDWWDLLCPSDTGFDVNASFIRSIQKDALRHAITILRENESRISAMLILENEANKLDF